MGRTFSFRLEKLLEARRLAEGAAERELAQARRAVALCEAAVLGLLRSQEEAREELRGLQQGALDARRLAMAGECLAGVALRLRREQLALEGRVKEEIEKRQRLVEARKGVRVLERYRERQRRLHRLLEERLERKRLDEVGQNLTKGA